MQQPSDDLRVMFDPQIFCHQRFGGISRYVCRLAQEMQHMPGVTARIAAPFHFNEYLDELPRSMVDGRRLRWLEGLTALAYGSSLIPAKFAARRFQPQVLHNTYYFPVKPPPGARGVVTVYDMIHEKHPQFFLSSRFITRIKLASVRAADQVICISQSTRRDLLAAFDLPEHKVCVTPLGFDRMNCLLTGESAQAFRLRVIGTAAPYILYVGSRANYKNFLGLLQAYSNSRWLRGNFQLLCFGGGNFSRAEHDALSSAGVGNTVRYFGGSDAELAAAYAHAALFVCPSLYEGFGIPVLEAMSVDCPVACSNISSLPEVVGDAAMLFDPNDPDAICAALESVLNSAAAAESLRSRARIRRELFSWRRCAQDTLDIYRRALQS
jgi:glycosyltransferase involved in cell wall biosynthesis